MKDSHLVPTVSLFEEADVARLSRLVEQTTVVGPELSDSGSREADDSGQEVPTEVDRFEVLGELGAGGMGRVLEARDPEIRRTVAIKLALRPTKASETALRRFLAEAQITGQLEHPNIIPVHDMGVSSEGEVYFVMKRIQGSSLADLLAQREGEDLQARQEWSRTRLLQAFIQVCNAVAYAHARGVLHRDIKPANIMLGAFGEVLLLDWGVARVRAEAEEERSSEPIDRLALCRTMDGVTIGTPGYMSPEQCTGELDSLDERSDVWSLGAVLYEILTGQRAYRAPNLYALLFSSTEGPPEDPRERRPDRRIPDEIAQICLQALATKPSERFADAQELARSVQAFLDGSKRREAAGLHLAQAEAARDRFAQLGTELQQLGTREEELSAAIPAWAPLSDKRELLDVQAQMEALESDRSEAFAAMVAGGEQALSQDPENSEARASLASAYLERFHEAETAGDRVERAYYERRVRHYDDGRHAVLLRGTGALSLRTDPPGAEVLCERFEPTGLVWPLVERRSLGRTPLEALPLEMGSYLLTLRAEGRRDTRYPVHIPRGGHWKSRVAVPLLSDSEIGPKRVYVPPGPFRCGGDPRAGSPLPQGDPWVDGFLVSVLPVTAAEYCEFVNAVHARDPDEAWSRVPRVGDGRGGGKRYWSRPQPGGSYAVPKVDEDGDPWSPDWPIGAISWLDARAFAAWFRESQDPRARLPTELEWEKAARGVDGRCFPWGDRFDPALCKMRDSRPGRASPEPVGSFASDCSVYGVRDTAGSMAEFCHDDQFDGTSEFRAVRGGSWYGLEQISRLAHRIAFHPGTANSYMGLRTVLALEGSENNGR